MWKPRIFKTRSPARAQRAVRRACARALVLLWTASCDAKGPGSARWHQGHWDNRALRWRFSRCCIRWIGEVKNIFLYWITSLELYWNASWIIDEVWPSRALTEVHQFTLSRRFNSWKMTSSPKSCWVYGRERPCECLIDAQLLFPELFLSSLKKGDDFTLHFEKQNMPYKIDG